MKKLWMVVIAAAALLNAGLAAPVAAADRGNDCIYIDSTGSPYTGPCNGSETTLPPVPPASPPQCVPAPGMPC